MKDLFIALALAICLEGAALCSLSTADETRHCADAGDA